LATLSGTGYMSVSANEPSLTIKPAVVLDLTTNPDRHYQLQSTTTLENPVWFDVGSMIQGDGTLQSMFRRTDSSASGFFRVVEYNVHAGLVAHYPLDGNANDMTEYENDGIVLGATLVKDRFGNQYGAYRFNGVNQYILVPHRQQQTLTSGDFTLSYWVSFEVLNPVSHLFGKSDGPGNTGKWLVRHESGSAVFKLDLNSITTGASANTSGVWISSSNVWTHVSHTRAGQNYQTYINGRMVSASQHPVLTSTSSSSLTIGQVEDVGWFQGSLDDIRMYNRALSAREIKALYDYQQVTLGQGLVAHYKFDGAPGQESVFGEHATATNVGLVENRFGRPDSAGSFSGNSRLELPLMTEADGLNLEFSISFWLQFQGAPAERHVLGRSNGGGNQKKWLWLYRPESAGNLSFLVNSQPNVETQTAKFTWPYSVNFWYHFVLIKQGSTYITYVNGLKSAQASGPSTLPLLTVPFRVGDVEGANGFQGKMDDLRIYSRAISESEVQSLGELTE